LVAESLFSSGVFQEADSNPTIFMYAYSLYILLCNPYQININCARSMCSINALTLAITRRTKLHNMAVSEPIEFKVPEVCDIAFVLYTYL
jgi:hypothetical protein